MYAIRSYYVLSEGTTGTPEYAEIKRRLGWEFNGMRLHEYYFENLGGTGALDPGGRLGKVLAAEFGSIEKWEADFRAVGAMRGIGWVILYQDPVGKRFFNSWVNEHDMGHPAGATPILVLDVFEHAFMIDYGLKRGDYLQAFFGNVITSYSIHYTKLYEVNLPQSRRNRPQLRR